MTLDLKKIFTAVENSSLNILDGVNDLKQRIKSAKNYVANSDLSHWAFSKQIATENFGVVYGSEAKKFFYAYNFVDVLKIKDKKFKNQIVDQFLNWAKNVEYIDLKQKFTLDQLNTKRFELLIHADLLSSNILKKEALFDDNFSEFVEGFKREIISENSYRNKNLIALAKSTLGTTCYACGFNFERLYGVHGKGFIEIHHKIPISKGRRASNLTDVVPVCSNCHRMLHKGPVTLTIEDLKQIIAKSKACS